MRTIDTIGIQTKKMWKTRNYDLPTNNNGEPIVLVPKSFVTNKFQYDAEYVLKNYILEEKLDELRAQYPSKRLIKSDALKKTPIRASGCI